MLKNKEVFNLISGIEQLIDTKANIISKEKRLEKDDVKSIIYLTTVNFFKKYYNKKRAKPITFFLNFCLPRARVEIIRQSSPIRLSYSSVEKGLYNDFTFTSLDNKNIESDNSDLYDLYASYEDNSIDIYDNKTYTNKLLNKSNLTAKEKKIVKMYFGFYKDREYTLKEIGKVYNTSYEMIRRIKDRSLNKIKIHNRIGEY